jgi:hypothetical protein
LSREGLKFLDPESRGKGFGAFVPITQNHIQLVAQGKHCVKRADSRMSYLL